MRKPILAALLTTNMMAAQAATFSPLPQFIQQCLSVAPIAVDQISSLDTPHAATTLETALLELFNFNDKLGYFRLGAGPGEKNQLLLCQVHLADELERFAHSDKLPVITQKLKDTGQPRYQALAQALSDLSKQQLSSADKSRLYTAQAAYRQALTSASMRLDIPKGRCQLTHGVDARHPQANKDIDVSIARYLLSQPDTDCRKQVWQAYQRRSAERNLLARQEINAVRQEQAQAHASVNAASFALAGHFLNTPQLVQAFLQTQTHNIDTPPWDIGRKLKALPKAQFENVSAYTLIALITPPLEELGLKVEQPAPQIYRFWYHDRLLGDLHLGVSQRPSMHLLVRPVIGRQFGTVLTLLPETITSTRQQTQALDTLAQSLAALSSSQPYYLLSANEASSAIGADWLTLWLQSRLTHLLPQAEDKRYQLTQAYSAQLKVFRAKLALAEATGMDKDRLKQQAADWFNASFGTNWTDADTSLAGFTGLADRGAEYYLPLWQQAVAELIFTQSQCCISPSQVYNTLLINPVADTLSVQLETLLQQPATPDAIIRRLSHDR